MSLNAGVLIIGSLLWDSDHDRPAWRQKRLDLTSAKAVKVPIRYGRLSLSRGNTYTMVFSRLCEAGQGKLLRCTRTISTSEDLIPEAEALWKAEQPEAAPGRIASSWGCVALLYNPDSKVPMELLKAWADRVTREPRYGNVSQTEKEGALLSEGGLLKIAWPRFVEDNRPVDVDLVLVTANDPEISPTHPEYPDANTIAAAWNAAPTEHAEYFWKNRENGITTFEDDQICALLRPRGEGRK